MSLAVKPLMGEGTPGIISFFSIPGTWSLPTFLSQKKRKKWDLAGTYFSFIFKMEKDWEKSRKVKKRAK